MDDSLRSAFGFPKLRTIQSRAAISAQQRCKKHFVIVPMEWIDRLAHARHASTFKVALELLHRCWKTGQQSVLLPNTGLAGVSRKAKWRALAELERLSLITVERRRRKTPRLLFSLCPAVLVFRYSNHGTQTAMWVWPFRSHDFCHHGTQTAIRSKSYLSLSYLFLVLLLITIGLSVGWCRARARNQ
jgi:hypothetical protein